MQPCENVEARNTRRWAASSIGAWFAGHAAPAAAALALGPWSMWQWPWTAAARRGLLHNVGHAVQRAPADPLAQRLARRAFYHLRLNYRDLLLAPRLDAAALDERVEIEGEAVLQRLRRRGPGAILLGGHFAGGELALQALAARGWPALIAAERLQPPALFAWMCRLRGSHGHRFVPSDALLTPVVRRLRQGGLVGLMMDRDTTGSGRAVMVCGAAARLPAGALRLSLRLGAPIVPLHASRRRDGSVLLHIEEPLVFGSTPDPEATLTNGLIALAARLERLITWQPDQWVLTTPLWETSVDDASCLLRRTTLPSQAASPGT